MEYVGHFRSRRRHRPLLELLESRIALAGDTTCELELADLPQTDATRAAHAVNCFALDLYEHFRAEDGNLFLSPLSISTALTMTYAGAAGETAAEMERVLHLGSEPGIHEAFSQLLSSVQAHPTYDLQSANALWPQSRFSIKEQFIEQIETQYGGHTQSLDFASDVEGARQTINNWVEDNTNNRIEELTKKLSPNAVMVLTNAVFFKALWGTPFDPGATHDGSFTLKDGSTTKVPMMHQSAFPILLDENFQPKQATGFAYSEQGEFRVLEMPYEGEQTSMVILLPKDGSSTDDLSPKTLADVQRWLSSAPERQDNVTLSLPKFTTTVSSDLGGLLPDMGMPRAFGNANFSRMTDAPVSIDQVGHKAFIEVNEQGTEAAAATFVTHILCFAKGTPVLTPDGVTPIEDITAGDYVMSRDEHNVAGQVEPMRVEQTFHGQAELLEVQIEDKKIRATAEHPLIVKGRGWTKAGDLLPGDLLSSELSSWVLLQKVTPVEGTHDVYNFRVARHHTYFVGGGEFGFAVWTHNCYECETVEYTVDKPFHFFIQDNQTSAMLFLGRISDPTMEAENSLKPHFVDEDEDPSTLPGDANGDQEVNFTDFLILSLNYGKEKDAIFAEGDFDNDGGIDFEDFLILSENFGRRAGG